MLGRGAAVCSFVWQDNLIADRHVASLLAMTESIIIQRRRRAGRVGWRHRADARARQVIAYPPQQKQIGPSILIISRIVVLGGLTNLILGQGKIR
jgi:hypothetical protein